MPSDDDLDALLRASYFEGRALAAEAKLATLVEAGDRAAKYLVAPESTAERTRAGEAAYDDLVAALAAAKGEKGVE